MLAVDFKILKLDDDAIKRYVLTAWVVSMKEA